MYDQTQTISVIVNIVAWMLMSTTVTANSEPKPSEVDAARIAPQNTDDGQTADSATTDSSATATGCMTFESLRPELLEKWNKIRSFTATVQSISTYGPPAERFSRRGDAQYEYMKRDGKELVRMIENNLHTIHRPEGDGLTRETVDSLLDGEYGYVITERSGRYRVVKHSLDEAPIMRLGGDVYLDLLSESYNIKVLPSESINDRPAYVFEATPKGGAAKLYHFVDQETGIAVKTSVTNDRAPSEMTVTVTNIKLDVPFDDGHFRFAPPPGEPVIDRSQSPDSSPAESVPAETADPASQDKPSADSDGSDD